MSWKELILVVVGVFVLIFLFVGGIMTATAVYNDYRAEQAKQRCLAEGMKPVPWGNTYWCR